MLAVCAGPPYLICAVYAVLLSLGFLYCLHWTSCTSCARLLVLGGLQKVLLLRATRCVAFLVTVAKGAAKSLGSTWGNDKNAWVSAIIAAGVALLTAVVVVPLLKRHSARYHQQQEKDMQEGLEAGAK
jgi:hypothetical protein